METDSPRPKTEKIGITSNLSNFARGYIAGLRSQEHRGGKDHINSEINKFLTLQKAFEDCTKEDNQNEQENSPNNTH